MERSRLDCCILGLDAIGGELYEDGALGTFEGETPCENEASGAFGESSASSCDDEAQAKRLTRDDLHGIFTLCFDI